MRVGYKRVSSAGQRLERQELPGVEKIFEEKLSAAAKERPQLAAMLDFIREGDTVVVHSLDRLARSLPDLEKIVGKILGKGASVEFVKENLRFTPQSATDPMSRLLFQVLGAFAEFERALIRERQREGIEKAKAAGKHLGRPKIDCEALLSTVQPLLAQGMSKREAAKAAGVSVATLYRCLRKNLLLLPQK